MPNKDKNIPKRRFKTFENDPAWELRKLGEVARFRRGSFPQPYGNSEWYDGDGAMPFVQVADVTDEMNLVGDTKQKISRKAQPLSVFAEEGSVLVTLQGSIGRVAITQYEAFIDRTVLIFENFNLPVDNLFWAYIIKQKFIEEAKCAPGGTIKTITKEVLSDFDIKLPSHPEQSAIGSFFSTLDRHITLHQRKLDKLKSVKQAYLSEMFPAEGERVPKRRFPGFTDDWELRKLGEVAPLRGGFAFKSSDFVKEGIPIVRISNILSNGRVGAEFVHYKELEQDERFTLHDGAAVLAMSGATTGKVSVLHVDEGEKYYQNQRVGYFTPTPGYNYDFIKVIVNSTFFTTQRSSVLVAGAQPNISSKEVDDFCFAFPKSLPEQSAIGTFFSTLDQQITLHQRKLEKLKNLKKALLNELFV
ncbi:restriction endonuclease subunit S [Streptococcus suis]|uniref:restriction endonuclease subunit S n=1 Tax=Streptococcus suis TaxID=1307 RepID=UPI0038BCF5F9